MTFSVVGKNCGYNATVVKERHTVPARILFRVKRLGCQARRGARNLVRPPAVLSLEPRWPYVLYESRTGLRSREMGSERLLTFGASNRS